MNLKLLAISLFIYSAAAGQNTELSESDRKQLAFYQKLFIMSDSLKTRLIDTVFDQELASQLRQLDRKHPAGYFQAAAEYLATGDLRKTAFLYYIGSLRYGYYNAANPRYQASNDGALSASLRSVLGEPVDIYVRSSVDNFLLVLQRSLSWYAANDYYFFSKNRNREKYDAQAKSLLDAIQDVRENKATYEKQWTEEINNMRKMITEAGTGSDH